MRTRARATRTRLRAIAPLVVSGLLIVTATVVVGFEPSRTAEIPDYAFVPVTVPSAGADPTASGAPSFDAPELRDPFAAAASPAGRAQPSLPAAGLVIVPIATPTPRPRAVTSGSGGSSGPTSTSHSLSGPASWYCRAGISPCTSGYPDGSGFDAYAAAGPKLRRAIGSSWRGKVVTVDGIRVKLIDWCQCYEGQSNEKLLDLYYDVFAKTGSAVTIRW